jgi:hypothetical protein
MTATSCPFRKQRKGLMSPKTVNDEWGTWFGSLTTEAIKRKGEVSTSVMFVTLTFKRNRRRPLAEGEPQGSRELEMFNRLYGRVCRQLVGRNYHRSVYQDELPTALACLDAEGTRFWNSKGELENLHIHSMWVLRTDQIGAFRSCVERPIHCRPDDLEIDGIDIQGVDGKAFQSVARIASYSSKLIGFNRAELEIAEDFRVYPTTKSRTLTTLKWPNHKEHRLGLSW